MAKWIFGAENAARFLGVHKRHFLKIVDEAEEENSGFENLGFVIESTSHRQKRFWLLADLQRLQRIRIAKQESANRNRGRGARLVSVN